MAWPSTELQDAVSNDLTYETWAQFVKKTLVEQGLWDVVKNGVPTDPSKISRLAARIGIEDLARWRYFMGKDMKALQLLQSSLPESVFRETVEVASAKDLWYLLQRAKSLKLREQISSGEIGYVG